MTNSAQVQLQEKINFYSNIYVEMVAMGIKNGIDGLFSGRTALRLLGCSDSQIDSFEESLLKSLNN